MCFSRYASSGITCVSIALVHRNGYWLWILLDAESTNDTGHWHCTGSVRPQVTFSFGDCIDGWGISGGNERRTFRAGLRDLERRFAVSFREHLCWNQAKSAHSIVVGEGMAQHCLGAESGKFQG